MAAATGTAWRALRLSEDWLATLVGLALVLAIASGVFGPGPQSAGVSAEPGESADLTIRSLADWRWSVRLGDAPLTLANVPEAVPGATLWLVCRDEGVTVNRTNGENSTAAAGFRLSVDNRCDSTLTVTLHTDVALRWPLLNLFASREAR